MLHFSRGVTLQSLVVNKDFGIRLCDKMKGAWAVQRGLIIYKAHTSCSVFYFSSFQAGVVDVDRHFLGKKERRELGTRTTPISPKPDGKKKKSGKGSEHSK